MAKTPSHAAAPKPPARLPLTPEQIVEIRRLRGQLTQEEVARRFGVSRARIGEIQRAPECAGDMTERRDA